MAPTDTISAETAAPEAASADTGSAGAPESTTAPATQAAAKPTEQPDLLGGDPADKPAETQAGEGDKAPAEDKPDAPKYELKAPEGAPFADNALEEIGTFAAELGLNQEQAQKLTDRYGKALTDQVSAAEAMNAETFKSYETAIRGDKTWGGSPENQRQTAAYVAKALDTAAPGYRQTLRDAGITLPPELYFLAASYGKAMSEPTGPVTGDSNPASERSYAQSFPNTPRSLGGSKKE